MHELGIARNVVAIVGERAGDQRVTRVRLEVGRLAAVVPDALRFCFDVCSDGTALQGATLEIDERPGQWRCRDCGHAFASDRFGVPCRCGSGRLDCIGGEELKVIEMETA